MNYDIDMLRKDAGELGISLSEEQSGRFLRYYEMLTEWNERVNLTAITEYGDVVKKHFADSLCLVKVYDPQEGASLMDVGTGAGFPGLALKIAFPGLRVTLLDSLNKRIRFLNAVIEELGLEEVKTLHGRAEDYARQDGLRESFDICTSRAVANLSTLSEYCLPFVKRGGLFVAYKAGGAEKEMEAARKAVALLGGRHEKTAEFLLPGSDMARTLFAIRKERETSGKYPRKAGLPGKDPL